MINNHPPFKGLNMSHSLNSLKGVIWGIIEGSTIGVIKGDTRSLDYGSLLQSLLRGGGLVLTGLG